MERAEAFLYCVEVKPDGCEYHIPLAPSWLVGEKTKAVAKWHQVAHSDRLQPHIEIVSDSEAKQFKAKKGSTVSNSRVVDPFNASRSWSLEALRGPEGLRRWCNDDVIPRSEDVFQERLYCIRWVNSQGERRYAAPDANDLKRESKVVNLLRERFNDWQNKGFIPSSQIQSGYNTDQPIRERGWTHWHHFFTPRQLLVHGLISEISSELAKTTVTQVGCLLGICRMANWNSRACAWMWHGTNEKGDQTFNNQALNTLASYSGRAPRNLRPHGISSKVGQ